VTLGNVRLKLQSEFEERCKRNHRYSLRAFAKALGMPVTSLQGILNGTRPLTSKSAQKLALALDWQNDLSDTQENYQQLTIDNFAVISDWYHYAILELLKVDGFKPEIQWIAKRLAVTPSEVRIAVERMIRLGLLEISGKKWRETQASVHLTNINGVSTNEASRRYQRQTLERSLRALQEVDVNERDHTSMVMAIDPKDLAAAREMIKEFRRKFCKNLEATKKPKEVYQIQISFFPLTQNKDRGAN
jgi:uncharacterized protein (TIGR02147 family)